MKSALIKYLWWLGERVLRRARPTIVAITGSSGKTSMKLMLQQVLATRYVVAAAPGNLNTDLGVPLAVLGFARAPGSVLGWIVTALAALGRAFTLRHREDNLILEFAADHPGDIGFLAKKIRPDVGIVTSLGPAHIGAFQNLKAIAREKLEICAHLSQKGACFLSHELVGFAVPSRKAHTLEFFGAAKFSSVYCTNVTNRIEQDTLTPRLSGELVAAKKKYSFELPFLGEHYQSQIAGAIAVGLFFGVAVWEGLDALQTVKLPPGRMELVAGRKGRVIINDCYNANPQSMVAALHTLAHVGGQRPTAAVISDMRELGRAGMGYHQKIGRLARMLAQEVYAIGPQAKHYDAPVWFESPSQATPFLLRTLPRGAIVLVKGSRGGGRHPYLLEVVQALQKNDNNRD